MISSLNRKLLRDLIAMKGQAFAITMVVASGVAIYVMYLSNFESLRETQRAYYERSRFGDVFVSLKRAPLALGAEIARSPASRRSRPAWSPASRWTCRDWTSPPPAGWSPSRPSAARR